MVSLKQGFDLTWFATTCPDLLDGLNTAYDEPHRAYHNRSHIDALLADFERLKQHFVAPEAVEIAIWYHDVIYQPFSKTNEKDSAARMRAEMSGRVDAAVVDTADGLILATETHAVPQDLAEATASDCALFLDMDMAILGTSPEVFDIYDAGVRTEYAAVPEEQYRMGRCAILGEFLSRDRIYLTDMFHRSHDVQARDNLKRAIAALS